MTETNPQTVTFVITIFVPFDRATRAGRHFDLLGPESAIGYKETVRVDANYKKSIRLTKARIEKTKKAYQKAIENAGCKVESIKAVI